MRPHNLYHIKLSPLVIQNKKRFNEVMSVKVHSAQTVGLYGKMEKL